MSLEMEVDIAHDDTKHCYKINLDSYDRFNILRNSSNGMTVLWNRYHVFVYERSNFNKTPLTFIPEFIIKQVILSSNYMVCLDSNGVAHTVPLKFKANTQNKIKIAFKPRVQGVMFCLQISDEYAATLQREENDFFLCFHKLNLEFKLFEKYKLEGLNTENLSLDTLQQNCLLKVINDIEVEIFKNVFKPDCEVHKNSKLILLTLDRKTVLGQIFNMKSPNTSIRLNKIFISPSLICDIQMYVSESLNIIIGLKSGTLVRLGMCENISELKAKVIHLNTAIIKFMPVKDKGILYTDGNTMWKLDKAKENSKFKQVFVKQTKDFLKYDNRIICVTYSDMLYDFHLESEGIYLYQNQPDDNFIPVPFDLSTSKSLVNEIMKEIVKNNDILKEIKRENNLTTAVALSRRPELLDKHIVFTVFTYESYEEVLLECTDIILSNELCDYFKPHTVLLLVKLTISNEFKQKFKDICACLLRDIQMHVTIKNENKVSFTTTIPIANKDAINCLIPFPNMRMTHLTVTTKIVSPIPGAFDPSQPYWTVLSAKENSLRSEHFIQTNLSNSRKVISNARDNKKPIKELIIDIAKEHHDGIINLQEPTVDDNDRQWTCYIKLPNDYHDRLSDKEYYSKTLNSKRSEILASKLGSDELLKYHKSIYFEVGACKVHFQMIDDEERTMMLRIFGDDFRIVFDLRRFFSELLYEDYSNYKSEEALISQAQYTRLENLRRKLKDHLAETNLDKEAVFELADLFHRDTLGALPI